MYALLLPWVTPMLVMLIKLINCSYTHHSISKKHELLLKGSTVKIIPKCLTLKATRESIKHKSG